MILIEVVFVIYPVLEFVEVTELGVLGGNDDRSFLILVFLILIVLHVSEKVIDQNLMYQLKVFLDVWHRHLEEVQGFLLVLAFVVVVVARVLHHCSVKDLIGKYENFV